MSTQTATPEVQEAFYQALNPSGTLDATLASLGVTGVYDEVPEDQPYDYISFGPMQELPSNAMGKRGYVTTAQVDIWSKQPGYGNAQAILARINTLLDQQHLSMQTQQHVYTMYAGSTQMRDPDVRGVRHIAAKYDVFSQE